MKKSETRNNLKQSQNSNNSVQKADDLAVAKAHISAKAPKISIIIPVYNVEQYLGECLDSVLHQSLRETEVICVDDGSTDGSLEILHQYAAQDKRIKVLTQQNKGAGIARNSALKIATGKFVAFMDSDDFYPSKHTLKNMYNAALKHHVLICGGSLNKIKDGELINDPQKLEDGYTFERNGYVKYKNYQFDYGYWRFIYDREFLVENQLYFPDYLRGQDPPFFIKAMSLAKEFYALKEATYVYRPNFKNIIWTERKVADNILSHADCLELCRQYDYKELSNRIINRMNNPATLRRYFNFKSDRLVINALKKLELLHPEGLSFIYSINTRVPEHISVIIPVYNVEPYLRECLDSVIFQTKPELEIICVNDGSPDNSLEILQEYAAKDSRIKLIDQENQGLSRTRNNALAIAKGEYVMFLDSDDWIRNDACEILYNKCKKYNLDMLNFAGTNFKNGSRDCFQWKNQTIFYGTKGKEIYDRKAVKEIIDRIPISSERYFYRRQFIEDHKIRFPEGINYEDNYFVRKAIMFVQNFGTEDKILIFKRMHSESITQNEGRFFGDYIEVARRIDELYTSHNFDFEITKRVMRHYCNMLYTKFNKHSYPVQQEHRPALFALMLDMQRKYNLNDLCYNFKDAVMREWLKWCQIRGLSFNIDHPKTFNEKIQWMKLHDSTPIKTRLADKYLVREWVKEKIGEKYLIPLIGVYDKFEDIDFDKLPNRFVMKCNHGCAYNIIVTDKNNFDIADAKAKINKWMRYNYAFRGCELHYMNIPHKIIIEEYIENNGGDLYDYKFWCFNGKVKYIQFLSERYIDGLKMAFYDMKWKKQTFVYDHPLDKKTIKKPDNLNKMVRLAETLSKDFNHVRVDFYRLNDGTILFGEMTFSSASGSCCWNDEKYNRMFGKLIKLPENAYDVFSGEYHKLPQNYHHKLFSVLCPEIPTPDSPKKHVISYKLLNFIPLFTYVRQGGRQSWEVLGIPMWKVRHFENNITTKYYLFGLPFIKVSNK